MPIFKFTSWKTSDDEKHDYYDYAVDAEKKFQANEYAEIIAAASKELEEDMDFMFSCSYDRVDQVVEWLVWNDKRKLEPKRVLRNMQRIVDTVDEWNELVESIEDNIEEVAEYTTEDGKTLDTYDDAVKCELKRTTEQYFGEVKKLLAPFVAFTEDAWCKLMQDNNEFDNAINNLMAAASLIESAHMAVVENKVLEIVELQ